MRYAKPHLYDSSLHSEFQKSLKAQVSRYFSSQSKSQKGNGLMAVKVLFFTALYWTTWSSLALHAHSLAITALLGVAFAFVNILLAFNISHDAVHESITGNKRLDSLIFHLTFNPLGPNAYLWKIRHNNAHHFFVNIPGSDMDIEGTSLLRVAPHVPWRPLHRFQHLYCSLFYSVFTLHWILFKDFKIMRMKSFGSMTDIKHSPLRWVEMIAWKLFYFSYMIALPVATLPYHVTTVLLGYVAFQLFVSFWLLLFFAASHIAMESHYVIQDDAGHIPHSFLEHQLLTSVDYHAQNRIFGFIFGGFNAHVAHHMFPQICSVHYPALTRIIRDTAQAHGLPYHELSFFQIIRSHFRLMKTLGQGPTAGERFVVSGTGIVPLAEPVAPAAFNDSEVLFAKAVAVDVSPMLTR